MDSFIINGGRMLEGKVGISGAKNSALPILAATILAGDRCKLVNCPAIRDIKSMIAALRMLGARAVADNSKGTVTVQTRTVDRHEIPYELVKTMRASILVLGPLLASKGKARISLPGGCAIGPRPIDIHLKGLEAMGTNLRIERGYVLARAQRLHGAEIDLSFPSVGATENLMMAAALAEGTTVITGAAMEPEIADLAGFINSMGGRIDGAGTERIVIEGVESLKGTTYEIMPDRIEAGTFLAAGAITGGDLVVEPMPAVFLSAFIEKLREAGVTIEETKTGLRVLSRGERRGVRIKTGVHPAFPTDLQAQMMALMCVTPGESVFEETIFENRFMHIAELRRMGAEIEVEGSMARVRGVEKLSGARIMASDLRASAALVLAGLVAEHTTRISRIYHIDRGYENFESKLALLGADIRRERDTAN